MQTHMSSLFIERFLHFRDGGRGMLWSSWLRLLQKLSPSTKALCLLPPMLSSNCFYLREGWNPKTAANMKRPEFFYLKRMITSQCLCFQRSGLQFSPELWRTVTAALQGSMGSFGGQTQWHFKLRTLWRSRFKKKNQPYWESTVYELRSKNTELGVWRAGFWPSLCHCLSTWP